MARGKKISVLVVDDSAFMIKAMRRMLGSDPAIRVVGEARDGIEAIRKIKVLKPDVVTLDVRMPRMDGLQALGRIMKECPTPVLMVSALTSEGGGVTLQALQAGAVDFIDKSSCHTMMDIMNIAETLIQKVKVLAGVDLKKLEISRPSPKPKALPPAPVELSDGSPSHLVVIGSSTGGPMTLEAILTRLPKNYPGAILVVQHMPAGFTRSLAERLNQVCELEVVEVHEDEPILPGWVYIAPAGYHFTLRRENDHFRANLSKEPLSFSHRPSVDVLMQSVAEFWPRRTLGVILTGMGNDGTQGIQFLKRRNNATIIAQTEETCVVFGMPKAAFLSGCVDRMVPLGEIAEIIGKFH